MSFLRGLGYGAGDALVTGMLRAWDQSRAARVPVIGAPASGLPPIARLGVCGISSIKETIAVDQVDDVLGEIYDENKGSSIWFSRYVDIVSAWGAAHYVMILGDHVLLVQVQTEARPPPTVHMVARADGLAAAIDDLTGGGARVTVVVCLVDAEEEPRLLPGPSGREVTVTGLPWLAGIGRRAILPGQRTLDELATRDDGRSATDGWLWPRLEQQMAQAFRSVVDLRTPYVALVSDPSWWVIRRLHLDDGLDEPIDLAAVGPTGGFVLEAARGAVEAAQDRAMRGAGRLRAYLPQATCLPVVVDRTAGDDGVLTDAVGQIAGWLLRPEAVAPAVRRCPTRGVDARTIAWLNRPAAGWRRSLGGERWTHLSIDYRL